MGMTIERYNRMQSLCKQFDIRTGYETAETGYFPTAIKRIKVSDSQFVTLSAQGEDELVAVERVIELIGRVKVDV